ncbi:MAG: hypothetical protein RI935_117 [Candidatus Parcubacteria bacterium]
MLLAQLVEIIDKIDLDKSGLKKKLEVEIERHKIFHSNIMGKQEEDYKVNDVDIRNYARYILQKGSVFEKRDMLGCFKSEIKIINKVVVIQ